MRAVKLRTRLLLNRLYAILFLVVSLTLFGFFFVKNYIINEAQRQVQNDLETVRAFYNNQFSRMALAFDLVAPQEDIALMQERLGLDYLFLVKAEEVDAITSEVVHEALATGQPVGAARIIPNAELSRMGVAWEDLVIRIQETPKSRPSQKEALDSVMSLEYVKPVFDGQERLDHVIYGGKIVNRNEDLIDEIVDAVFEKRLYYAQPVGTVTIFQDDVRIATNVLDSQRKRALGTRVSQEVYQRVLEKGQKWLDRAFVVKDWYITAYEPIHDIRGRLIGILYVGILEQPFTDMGHNVFLVFLLIILGTSLLSGGFSVLLANSIDDAVMKVVHKTHDVAEGKLDTRVEERTPIRELDDLAASFNSMAERLAQREKSLAVSNRKLEDLNKDYLELVGFVSHELKGILSSIVLNTYMLRTGVMGQINEKQEHTLKSMARNLDYLAATVKNFLNLSRIEKGELKLNIQEIRLKEDVFRDSVEAFAYQAQEKGMTITDELPENVRIQADPELMQIVANNLLSNAVKYGNPGGHVRISGEATVDMLRVEVYNDSRPIVANDLEKLFRKFSRLSYEGMEKVKGTGVGLFITREIVERHGGAIRVEPREKGNAFVFIIKK